MADLDLWTEESGLSNFADDTQSVIISVDRETALRITKREANSVINFFSSNNLVNNSDKAAVLVNCKGKGEIIKVEGIGGEDLTSTETEKLLGLHINHDLDWKTHIEKLSSTLKKSTGMLCRIKTRVPKDKVIMIAEGIFNSVLRYGIAVYLNPVYEKEDIKARKLPGNTRHLQTIQNNIRVILGFHIGQHINMEKIRHKINMMSVNQIAIYHTLLETFNVLSKGSSEQLKNKWKHTAGEAYALRRKENCDLKVPDKPLVSCTGFSYHAPKLFNQLPTQLKKITDPDSFKEEIKAWIWDNIPPY